MCSSLCYTFQQQNPSSYSYQIQHLKIEALYSYVQIDPRLRHTSFHQSYMDTMCSLLLIRHLYLWVPYDKVVVKNKHLKKQDICHGEIDCLRKV